LAANERQLVILLQLLAIGITVVGYVSDVLDNFLLRGEGTKLRANAAARICAANWRGET
jgi:hypothetical protein